MEKSNHFVAMADTVRANVDTAKDMQQSNVSSGVAGAGSGAILRNTKQSTALPLAHQANEQLNSEQLVSVAYEKVLR